MDATSFHPLDLRYSKLHSKFNHLLMMASIEAVIVHDPEQGVEVSHMQSR